MMIYLTSNEDEVDHIEENEAPEDVCSVVRLQSNIQALAFILEGDEPTRITCRVRKTEWVAYGIGDVFGDGFGAASHIGDD